MEIKVIVEAWNVERCCYGSAWNEPCPFVADPEDCLLYETGREMDLCVRIKRIAKEEAIEDELAAEEMAREYEDDDGNSTNTIKY